MAQLMPLPFTVSCFSKIQIGFTFLVPADLGSPGKRAVKRVCVLGYLWRGGVLAGDQTFPAVEHCLPVHSHWSVGYSLPTPLR